MGKSRASIYAELTVREAPTGAKRLFSRALVLGAGMAGLLAARVLGEHADQVTILEWDETDPGGGTRPGVPQGSQVHALLPAGQVQLERWFPGLTEEVVAGGAVLPTAERIKFFMDDVPRPIAVAEEAPIVLATRPYLESIVRRRTLERENVRIVTGRVQGLVFAGDRVTGAHYSPDGAPGEPSTEDADLVVDAMGRASRVADWLEENGWTAPPLQRMPIKLNYATAGFRRDPEISDVAFSGSVVNAGGNPPRTARTGGIHAVEGERWNILVAGYDQDRPEHDAADFIARCRDDFPPLFGQIAQKAEMLGDVVTYHQADSRRRDYDKLERMPARLLVTGDAVASVNPVYGQGMACAALHASCLSSYLRSDPDLDAPAKPYFDLVRIVVDAAWQTSAFPDLALPHVEGPCPPGYKMIKRISDMVAKAALTDEVINVRLARMTGMLIHPDAVMSPDTMLRTLRSKLRRSKAPRG